MLSRLQTPQATRKSKMCTSTGAPCSDTPSWVAKRVLLLLRKISGLYALSPFLPADAKALGIKSPQIIFPPNPPHCVIRVRGKSAIVIPPKPRVQDQEIIPRGVPIELFRFLARSWILRPCDRAEGPVELDSGPFDQHGSLPFSAPLLHGALFGN
jgi:hypothetical protein